MFNLFQKLGYSLPLAQPGQYVLKAPALIFESTGPKPTNRSVFKKDAWQGQPSGPLKTQGLPQLTWNLTQASSAKPTGLSPSASEHVNFKGQPAIIAWSQRYTQSTSRIPAGFQQIKGALPRGLSEVASHILKQKNPLGTYTPFELNGKAYVALNEYHSHYASRPHDPPAKIYAITVFERKL